MKNRIVLGSLLAIAFFLVPGISHARWMNPNTGRFQTMDSYEGNQTDSLSLHKYLYCQANPVNLVDLSGCEGDSISLGAAMTLGGTVGATTSYYANIALGRAQTAGAILQGAAYGSLLGPFAVEYPLFGAGLGFYGAYEGIHSFAPILRDPNATFQQRVSASGLIVAAVYGAKAGFDYAKVVRSIRPMDGSGPEAGILEVSVFRKSTKAFENYNPSGGGQIEFVFDPSTQRFVVGKSSGGSKPLYSPHELLASSIGAKSPVGGMFKRGTGGEILTNEHSGHFNQNWTPAIRSQLVLFLEAMTGQKVVHSEGPTW